MHCANGPRSRPPPMESQDLDLRFGGEHPCEVLYDVRVVVTLQILEKIDALNGTLHWICNPFMQLGGEHGHRDEVLSAVRLLSGINIIYIYIYILYYYIIEIFLFLFN